MELDKFIIGAIVSLVFVGGIVAGYIDLRTNYGQSDNTFSNCQLDASGFIDDGSTLALNTSGTGSGSQDKLSTDALGYAFKAYDTQGNLPSKINCVSEQYGLDQSLNKFPIAAALYTVIIIGLAIAAYRLVIGTR